VDYLADRPNQPPNTIPHQKPARQILRAQIRLDRLPILQQFCPQHARQSLSQQSEMLLKFLLIEDQNITDQTNRDITNTTGNNAPAKTDIVRLMKKNVKSNGSRFRVTLSINIPMKKLR
jgi:hypothetical protein